MRVHVLLSLLVLATAAACPVLAHAETSLPEAGADSAELALAEAVIPTNNTGRPAGSDAAPIAEPKTDSNVSVTAYGHVASGRIFQDQAFTLTEKPAFEGGVTVCYRGTLCVDAWQAVSLVGRSEDRETDLVVWKDVQLAEQTTLQVKSGRYWLPGPDVWDVKVTLTHEVSKACSVIASGEAMREGFVDNVAHAELACAVPLPGAFELDGNVGPSYSTWSGIMAVGYEVGVSHPVTDSFSLRAFAKGYTSKHGSDTVLGFGFSKGLAFK